MLGLLVRCPARGPGPRECCGDDETSRGDFGEPSPGIEALRAYWAEGLRRNPALHLEVTGVYAGIDTVVITHRHQSGRQAAEVLTFRDGLIVSGMGTCAA